MSLNRNSTVVATCADDVVSQRAAALLGEYRAAQAELKTALERVPEACNPDVIAMAQAYADVGRAASRAASFARLLSS